MTIEVRRSSRRSILETKKDTKSVKAVPSPKKQVTKKVGKKAINKQNVVNLIETQKKLEPKKCNIKVYKLQEAKGDYKQSDIAVTEKLSKEEKQLLIPKKGAKTLVPLQAGVKKKRGRKPKNKGGKFQLKIRQNDDDAEPEDEDAHDEDNDLDRPDSGFSSRADTPRSLSGSPAKEDSTTGGELNEDMENENKKFLAELDEGLSSDQEEESDWDGDSDDGFKKAAKRPVKKTKKQHKARAALNAPIELPGVMKSELSEYEKLRAGNIKERQDMLAALMADFASFKKDSGLGPKTTVGGGGLKRKRKEKVDIAPDQLRRSTRVSMKPEDKEKLGSEKWNVDTGDRHRLAEEYSDYDSDDYEIYEKVAKQKRPNPNAFGRGNLSKDPNIDVLMPEDITQKMLDKVIDRFGDKVYCQKIGTSCHQCRQKTVDMKTVCRSGQCIGVRGQFCGRCLALRYGEDAREALMDPHWACPPCRGFCNCSICRNRSGKGATGILIHLAQAKGFSNVGDYLKHLTKKSGTDDYDE